MCAQKIFWLSCKVDAQSPAVDLSCSRSIQKLEHSIEPDSVWIEAHDTEDGSLVQKTADGEFPAYYIRQTETLEWNR